MYERTCVKRRRKTDRSKPSAPPPLRNVTFRSTAALIRSVRAAERTNKRYALRPTDSTKVRVHRVPSSDTYVIAIHLVFIRECSVTTNCNLQCLCCMLCWILYFSGQRKPFASARSCLNFFVWSVASHLRFCNCVRGDV